MISVGDIVAGKYSVTRVLGAGGMAQVVAAQHLELKQGVALKLMLRSAHDVEPTVIERFAREARASAQLRGEHVCRIADVGALGDGSPYMVMELLEGRDLAGVVATRGPLPVVVAVDYVLQACIGLAEAHALGIVHRDMKPANLFLAERPDGSAIVKVLDFGIAKTAGELAPELTQACTILGSPGYMSPEQLRGARDAGVRSDIWSLGIVLYELVSGRRPFDGGTFTDIAVRVTLDPPPPLPPSVPRRFADVVRRCLEKDPALRFPHLGALAEALAACGRPDATAHAVAVARMLNMPQRIASSPGGLDASRLDAAAALAVTQAPCGAMPTTLR
ncbi:MAG: serine/threonine protein kinase, partial [Deltaproteobacteria bacterium]|nr:serine/threonine protein kinase [Deltaproteobacteria bacterium]